LRGRSHALRGARPFNRFTTTAVWLLPTLVALACSGAPKSAAGNGADTTPVVPYRPGVDEGLGASVAILLDNSGSMSNRARRGGDERPKFLVARQAIEAMLAATDSFVARHNDVPVNVGLYRFASDVETLVPVRRYDARALHDALESMPDPKGGTAIGDAMDAARADLYRAGTFRKYLLVVTDGENTSGRRPDRVAREIAARSEGAVRMYFVAFDVDARRFAFVNEVKGEVLGATDGAALRANLDTIYRGKILAESIDIGETLPSSTKGAQAPNPSSPSPEKRKP
jgi:hypothetical protein